MTEDRHIVISDLCGAAAADARHGRLWLVPAQPLITAVRGVKRVSDSKAQAHRTSE
ncbi:hypothetical protein [Roseomonas chloroacetimidivorans]|uniref:hypothetical protein n=1 Tax=Roseomonas chloroacetimidivorans TaxID=1766656 RepID=UPI003C731306